uniref:Urotensin-2 n=2 Tax=Gobiidae TaxID=8220 RepID=UTS2_GILMI|nr:RecName: Full=Urotensin-2; AltName: Full=Urotensin II; Short=U-II; Short=UII [Gillichthys mirabilis]
AGTADCFWKYCV